MLSTYLFLAVALSLVAILWYRFGYSKGYLAGVASKSSLILQTNDLANFTDGMSVVCSCDDGSKGNT